MTKENENKVENTVINSEGILFAGTDPCDLIVNDQELHFEGGVAQIFRLFAAQMKFDDLDTQRDVILHEMDTVNDDITDNFPMILEDDPEDDEFDPDEYTEEDKLNDLADAADAGEDPGAITQKMVDDFLREFDNIERLARLKAAKRND